MNWRQHTLATDFFGQVSIRSEWNEAAVLVWRVVRFGVSGMPSELGACSSTMRTGPHRAADPAARAWDLPEPPPAPPVSPAGSSLGLGPGSDGLARGPPGGSPCPMRTEARTPSKPALQCRIGREGPFNAQDGVQLKLHGGLHGYSCARPRRRCAFIRVCFLLRMVSPPLCWIAVMRAHCKQCCEPST